MLNCRLVAQALHYQIVFADGFMHWVPLSEIKQLPPIADLAHHQRLSMMHVACYVGDLETVKQLLVLEISPTEEDERGQSAVQVRSF